METIKNEFEVVSGEIVCSDPCYEIPTWCQGIVKAKNGTHTHVSELVLTLDTSDNIALNEYAITTTNGSLMDKTADIDSGNVRLRVTPANNNTEVMAHATLLV